MVFKQLPFSEEHNFLRMKRHLIAVLVCCLFMSGCKDKDVDSSQYSPSQPVVFTDFSPKEGVVRTRLYIEGSNFGSDVSKIHITIGGQSTNTIGSDGKKIFCMVPPKSYSGEVNVSIEGPQGDIVANYTFEQPFKYQSSTTVGTTLRKVDENGQSAFQDGSFDEGASVPTSDWLVFDPRWDPNSEDPQYKNRMLFSSTQKDGVRVIDLTNRTVKTLFPRVGYNTLHTFTFDAISGDTLLFTDDHGQNNCDRANIFYALRRESFRKIHPYNYGKTAYSVVHMQDGSVFYTTYWDGTIYKMNRGLGNIPNVDTDATACFNLQSVGGGSGELYMLLHPSGKFVYITSFNLPGIVRVDYNPETKMLHNPRLVVGHINQRGYKEGTGLEVRFNKPWGGVFKKNDAYGAGVGANRDDQYDLYLADRDNHCIWKVTPDYVCTCIAGRSNENADGKTSGYVDGDPLHESRFNNPASITYDPTDEIIYIGDINNKALRYIATE